MLRGHQLSGTRRLNGHYQNGAIKERWGWIFTSEGGAGSINTYGSAPDKMMFFGVYGDDPDVIKESPWSNLANGIWLKFKYELPAGYGALVDGRQLYAVGSGYPSYLDGATIYYPAIDSLFGPAPYGGPIYGIFSFDDWTGSRGQEYGWYRANMSWPIVLDKSVNLSAYNFSTSVSTYNRYLTDNTIIFYAYIPFNFYTSVQNVFKRLRSWMTIIGPQSSDDIGATIYIRYATDVEVQREGMIV